MLVVTVLVAMAVVVGVVEVEPQTVMLELPTLVAEVVEAVFLVLLGLFQALLVAQA